LIKLFTLLDEAIATVSGEATSTATEEGKKNDPLNIDRASQLCLAKKKLTGACNKEFKSKLLSFFLLLPPSFLVVFFFFLLFS
jgi:hypothetical protein